MIKIGKRDTTKSIVTEMELLGEQFEIELLPMDEAERIKVFEPFMKRKSIRNPVEKRMEELSYFEDKTGELQKKTEDLLDKHIITFSGIGDLHGNELDGSLRENKILLGSIEVDETEEVKVEDPQTKETVSLKQEKKVFFRKLIFDKCVELSKTIAETETKN